MELRDLTRLVDDLALAVARVEGLIALDSALSATSARTSELTTLKARYLHVAGVLGRANHALLVAMRRRYGKIAELEEARTARYDQGGVPPVDVPPGAAAVEGEEVG
jgi:hypothetical protein